MAHYLGIDLGGTNIDVGVVDETFSIVARVRRKTNLPREADAIVSDIADAAREAAWNAGLRLTDVDAVGIGSPGSVNVETGLVEYSNNFAFHNVPLRDMLENFLQLPVFIANDANAAAYGEFLAGAGRGTRDYVAITLGTGVGGGVIVGSKLYTGFNGAAGELGHTVIATDGPICTCGRHGCVESFVSATALIRETRGAMASDLNSAMWTLAPTLHDANGKTAFDAVKLGDETAKRVVDRYVEFLAAAIVNFVNIFQPERLSIGGGVSQQGEDLLRPLNVILTRDRYSRNNARNTELVISKLGNDAGVIGAAMLHKLAE